MRHVCMHPLYWVSKVSLGMNSSGSFQLQSKFLLLQNKTQLDVRDLLGTRWIPGCDCTAQGLCKAKAIASSGSPLQLLL